MTVLIGVTVVTMQREGADLDHALDEAVSILVPLATLEYDLQRALTDEFEGESQESVPDFDGLTTSIDRAFSELRSVGDEPDMSPDTIDDAQRAWQSAQPTIARLVKHVKPLSIQGGVDTPQVVRAELERALRKIDQARTHLASAVRAHVAAAQGTERRQLRILVWTWASTVLIVIVVMVGLVYSIVRPTRELGWAVRRLSSGDLSVRIDDGAGDELAEVAAYLNDLAKSFASRRRDLEDKALQDPLTHLPNRRAILEALEGALASGKLVGAPVSVLMIDVDHFKSINDRFGHATGDRALVWLAESMRSTLRQGDVLGRYGGDEYLAVLPETSKEEAHQIAKRLCEVVNAELETDPRKPSVTIGSATGPVDGDTFDALIQAADQALYRGKRSGRTRVELAQS
jgi:diguanylate cyclase (GGDEF)-like protein